MKQFSFAEPERHRELFSGSAHACGQILNQVQHDVTPTTLNSLPVVCYTDSDMTYDGLVLAATVAELHTLIAGSRIQKVRQHSDTDLTLEVHGAGRTHQLFLSVDAKFPRVYLSAVAGPVPSEPPNFCMVLRKHVQGAFVAHVQQAGFDRVMKLVVRTPGQDDYTLILEIMGKHSNLILVDSNGKILGAAKHVGASVSRYRQVLPGRQYIPPPGAEKTDPRFLDAEHLKQFRPTLHSDAQSARAWLMDTFSGFGPFLADEIVARSTTDGEVNWDRLREELLGLAKMIRASTYVPVLITREQGQALMAYPMPSVQFPPDRQHARASINETLDTVFRSLVTRTRIEDERAQLLTAVRRSEGSRKQALKSIDRTIAESERADSYRQRGELILAGLNQIEKGAASVTLVNYFDPDMPEVEIEFDEKLTPQQNAERYFRRYRKARDAAATARARRQNVLREITLLTAAREEAESAATIDGLKDLRAKLVGQDLLRQEVDQEKQAEEFAGHRIRRTVTSQGWEILHGETSDANDYLTQRVARPNDVWLHARAITGAHVVVRTAGHSGAVPKDVLLQAALIAARNSDAKHSSLVPVDYTLRKYVRKPRGSAPGFVTYRNERTIDVRPKE